MTMLMGVLGILTLSRLAPWADYIIGADQGAEDLEHQSNSTGPFTQFSDRFYSENFGPHNGNGITESMRIFTTVDDTVTLIYLLVLGCFYKHRVTDQRPLVSSTAALTSLCSLATPPHDFRTSCCDCHGGVSVWAWSILAWSARMGDTYHTAGVTNFWAPWAVYAVARIGALIIGAIPGMLGGIPTLSMKIAQSLVYAKWRQALRIRLGSPASEASTLVYVKDTALYVFLPFCLIAQEALEVDRATDTKIVGVSLLTSKYSIAESDCGQP